MSSRMVRIRRQVPFLQSLVCQAKGKQRDTFLRAANADQINAMSEMVLNVLTNDKFPVRPDLVARLRPHKKALRELRKKKNSVKRRREILLKQKGGLFLEHFGSSMSLFEHMYDTFVDDLVHDLETNPGMDGTDATSRGSSPVGLERFETDHEIVQGPWCPTTTHTRSYGTERHRRSKRPEKRLIKV